VEEVGIVGEKEGKERKVQRRKEERKEEKNWGKERKVEQERDKQIEIWTDWKKEKGNNKFLKIQRKGKRKNFFLVMERSGFALSSMSALGTLTSKPSPY
jgi:hypothetical protein